MSQPNSQSESQQESQPGSQFELSELLPESQLGSQFESPELQSESQPKQLPGSRSESQLQPWRGSVFTSQQEPWPHSQPELLPNQRTLKLAAEAAHYPVFRAKLWVSFLLFGLFSAWLSPVYDLGGADARELIVIFGGLTALLLLNGCFTLPGWVLPVFPLFAVCGIMIYLYGSGDVWGWLQGLGAHFAGDAAILRHTGNLAEISGETRFLILLLGWTLLVLSVQMLALSRFTVLLFLGITVVYLFAFELTVPLDMFWPVVCVFGLGLLLQFSVHAFKRANTGNDGSQELYCLATDTAKEAEGEREGRLESSPGKFAFAGQSSGKFTGQFSGKLAGEPLAGSQTTAELLANPGRLLRPAQSRVLRRLPLFWSACAVAAAVSAAAFAALLLPAKPAEPAVWAQAVRTMEAWTETNTAGDQGAGSSLTGYGGSDEVLGAPLRLRKDVFFTAMSPKQTYWRGGSLSYYDGRGWSDPDLEASWPENNEAEPFAGLDTGSAAASPAGSVLSSAAGSKDGAADWAGSASGSEDGAADSAGSAPGFEDGQADSGSAGSAAASISTFSTGENSRKLVQSIKYAEPQKGTVPLFSGGSLIRVGQVDMNLPSGVSGKGYKLFFDPVSDASYLKPSEGATEVYGYQLVSALNESAGEARVQPQADPAQDGPSSDPSEIRYRYLQLPASLPDSVRKLGAQIIANPGDRMSAAEAVEVYLKSHYKYTLNSNVPPEGADFVADFLFRQKEGYCDHFSTAMVVLLRSQGIPARWVKGYAPGEQTAENEYTVRYSDAHAWVEVYVSGRGWISFDPTPGFDGVLDEGTQREQAQTANDTGWAAFPDWKQIRMQLAAFAAAVQVVAANVWQQEGWFGAAGISLTVALLVLAFCAWPGTMRKPFAPGGEKRANALSGWRFRGKRDLFPGRVDLLRAADKAWAGLYSRYGAKAAGATALEYAEALHVQLQSAGLKDEFAGFLAIWETLYYGRSLPDRQTTQTFLKTCRKLAAGQKPKLL